SFSGKIDLRSRRIGDGRTVSAGGHTPAPAESFIRGATLRTRGRAGRSAEDRLLCKQEALGSNPSRSTLLEVHAEFRVARIQFGPWSTFRYLFGLALMRWRRHRFSFRRRGINVSRRQRPKSNSPFGGRSEEHTSELQSRFDLVCRLLLEKKKIRIYAFLFD